MAVSWMRNASDHTHTNSLVIVELATGQIAYHVAQNVFLVFV